MEIFFTLPDDGLFTEAQRVCGGTSIILFLLRPLKPGLTPALMVTGSWTIRPVT